jgi:hypothetical protein
VHGGEDKLEPPTDAEFDEILAAFHSESVN